MPTGNLVLRRVYDPPKKGRQDYDPPYTTIVAGRQGSAVLSPSVPRQPRTRHERGGQDQQQPR